LNGVDIIATPLGGTLRLSDELHDAQLLSRCLAAMAQLFEQHLPQTSADPGEWGASFSIDYKSSMTEAEASPKPTIPDHLSIDPRNPHHVAAVFEHDIGIRFNDVERSDVEEYCISEGWIKVPAGKAVDRIGKPLMLKLKGKVEAFYK
jgi:hypothetical protein